MSKMKGKPAKMFFTRAVFVGICLMIQVAWLVSAIWKLSEYYWAISTLLSVLSVIVVLVILNKRDNPAYKQLWTIIILSVPFFGVLLYLFCGRSPLVKRFQRRLHHMQEAFDKELIHDSGTLEELEQADLSISRISRYLYNMSGSPVYKNTDTVYYPMGEDFFKAFLVELENAKHFIFLEYFIIQEGKMWNTILDILVRKVKEGVEVRVLYDDMGCVAVLPYKYNEKLISLGIKCRTFNPFLPVLSVMMDHRDHRKIAVIDGHTGYSGGLNLADEYINEIHPCGNWKDSAIMLKGDAVWSLTSMFLQMWNTMGRMDTSFDDFRPRSHAKEFRSVPGFVQPFDDSPLDDETVGEFVYLNMINRAKKYIYIYTPYLIIDNEMMTGLCLAAKSGVDVRIVTPHIPDKKLIFMLTRSYYSQLVDSGVRILEYTPGFMHSKCFLCDDEMAVVSTINLDYRSLYHHFECGVFLYKTESIFHLKDDFEATFKVGKEITREYCDSTPRWTRIIQGILRLAAPLL